MTQAVTTTLSTSHVVMEAGQERESEILVRNQGDEMDQFTVQVLGPAAAWTTVVPSVVTVPAGEEEWVRVVYAPPRSAEARQGKSHVAFRVTSYNDPSTSTLEEAVVEVAAFAELEVRLDPPQRTSTRRGRFVLTAINRGNSPVRCQANAYGLDEGEGLDILIAGPEFSSEPGSTTQLPVRVQAKRRFMRGQDQSLPFAVEVNGDILERPAMVEGVLNQAPVLNAARLKLLLAALALLALVLGGWFTWYSLTGNDEALGGSTNGQAPGAPASGGQAPVVGEAGVAGSSGTAGLPGLPGAAGNQGLAGEAGAAGLAGGAGAKGDAGAGGAAGTAGAAGKDGDAGAQGAAGLVGQPGTSGTNGANGTRILGTVATADKLPTYTDPGDIGSAYVVSADRRLYVWDGKSWNPGPVFQGADGTNGTDGTDGRNGTTVEGVVATYGDLQNLKLNPTTDVGKGYVVTADRKLYVWNGTTWNAGIPFQGADGKDAVLPPQSVVLALPTVQPQAQPIEMTHFIPSGASALYYIRSDSGPAEINQISVVDRPGGKGTLTLASQGPGTGDKVTATATTAGGITAGGPFDSAIAVTPRAPILVEFVCTPDPGYQACNATVTVTYRAPVSTTMALTAPTAPTDPASGVTAAFPAVHHQQPNGKTFTRYTVTSDGGDAEVVGATLSDEFGGSSALALGSDALGADRTTVTATTPQTFGAQGTQPVVVSPGNPLTIDVSCPSLTGTFNTCGGTLGLTVRKPKPVDLQLTAPRPDGVTTQTFDLSRSPLTNSPARFLLRTPVDRQVTGIAAVDTDATKSSQSVVALGAPPATGARTTITSAADFRSSPWAGQVLVTPVTPYAVDVSCSTANAATGCAVRVAVTFGPPPPTDLSIPGGDAGPQPQTIGVRYDPSDSASGSGRYWLRPASDSTVSTLQFSNADDPGSVMRVQPAGATGMQTVGPNTPIAVKRMVTTAVPLLVEFSCSPAKAAGSCKAQLMAATAKPAAAAIALNPSTQLTYNPSASPTAQSGRYLLTPAGDRGLSSLSLDDQGAAQGATLLVTPPSGTPFTVTPGTAWNAPSPLLVTNKVPLLVELRCGPTFAATGCSASLAATTAAPAPAVQPILAVAPDLPAPQWSFAAVYDAAGNKNGLYAVTPPPRTTGPADLEFVTVAADAGNNVAGVSVAGYAAAPSWTGSAFVNPSHPLVVALVCADPARPCSTKLTVTGRQPLPSTLSLPAPGESAISKAFTFGAIDPGATGRYLLRVPDGSASTTITSISLNLTGFQPYAYANVWPSSATARRGAPLTNNSWGNQSGGPVVVGGDDPALLEVTCNGPGPCTPTVTVTIAPGS